LQKQFSQSFKSFLSIDASRAAALPYRLMISGCPPHLLPPGFAITYLEEIHVD